MFSGIIQDAYKLLNNKLYFIDNLRYIKKKKRSHVIYKISTFYKQWRWERSELTILLERRKRGDLIEIFKIINGIFCYGGHFFIISPQTGNLLSTQPTNWIFCQKRIIFSEQIA